MEGEKKICALLAGATVKPFGLGFIITHPDYPPWDVSFDGIITPLEFPKAKEAPPISELPQKMDGAEQPLQGRRGAVFGRPGQRG